MEDDKVTTTIQLHDEVPPHLHCSDAAEEYIEIPVAYAKFDTSIKSKGDLWHPLETCRYWGVDEAPDCLVDCTMQDQRGALNPCYLGIDIFVKDLSWLKHLTTCLRSPIAWAAMRGDTRMLRRMLVNPAVDLIYTLRLDMAMEQAVEKDQLESLKVINEAGYIINSRAYKKAAIAGKLSLLAYIHNESEDWISRMLREKQTALCAECSTKWPQRYTGIFARAWLRLGCKRNKLCCT